MKSDKLLQRVNDACNVVALFNIIIVICGCIFLYNLLLKYFTLIHIIGIVGVGDLIIFSIVFYLSKQ